MDTLTRRRLLARAKCDLKLRLRPFAARTIAVRLYTDGRFWGRKDAGGTSYFPFVDREQPSGRATPSMFTPNPTFASRARPRRTSGQHMSNVQYVRAIMDYSAKIASRMKSWNSLFRRASSDSRARKAGNLWFLAAVDAVQIAAANEYQNGMEQTASPLKNGLSALGSLSESFASAVGFALSADQVVDR